MLREPTLWACQVCGSTDGVWVCFACGHVGCGRRATSPQLGGGHARHHHFAAGGDHNVCIDTVSQARHCQACDGWTAGDPPWMEEVCNMISAAEARPPCTSPADRVAASPKEAPTAVPPGRTGLANLGNTCYMNSVVQALSNTAGFRAFFRDYVRASAPVQLGSIEIRKQDTPKWKATAEAAGRTAELQLCSAMHGLLRVLWSGVWRSASPHELVQAVWTHVGAQFASRRQHDAQEFLIFLLNRLSDELSAADRMAASVETLSPVDSFELSAHAPGGSAPASPSSSAAVPEAEQAGSSSATGADSLPRTNFLHELYGVDTVQTVTCGGCGGVFRRPERSFGLQLSLPPDERPGQLRLEDCLDHLTATEALEGECAFYCDVCQAHREARRCVKVGNAPQALILLLSRTRWDLTTGQSKDGRRVAFPTHLSLSPWMTAPSGPREAARTADPSPPSSPAACTAAPSAQPVSTPSATTARPPCSPGGSPARSPSTRLPASPPPRGQTTGASRADGSRPFCSLDAGSDSMHAAVDDGTLRADGAGGGAAAPPAPSARVGQTETAVVDGGGSASADTMLDARSDGFSGVAPQCSRYVLSSVVCHSGSSTDVGHCARPATIPSPTLLCSRDQSPRTLVSQPVLHYDRHALVDLEPAVRPRCPQRLCLRSRC